MECLEKNKHSENVTKTLILVQSWQADTKLKKLHMTAHTYRRYILISHSYQKITCPSQVSGKCRKASIITRHLLFCTAISTNKKKKKNLTYTWLMCHRRHVNFWMPPYFRVLLKTITFEDCYSCHSHTKINLRGRNFSPLWVRTKSVTITRSQVQPSSGE